MNKVKIGKLIYEVSNAVAQELEKSRREKSELEELRERSKDFVIGPIRIGNFGGGGR